MSEKAWAACPFCNIINGYAEATVLHNGFTSLGIVPLNPVTDGHVLFIPRTHVADAYEAPSVTAATMRDAAAWATSVGGSRYYSANLITSVGRTASQSVRHLHIHIVPRADGDGLPLPWTPQQEGATA